MSDLLNLFEEIRTDALNKTFDKDTVKKLQRMVDAVDSAYNAEDRINNLRNDLRDAEIDDTENNTNNYQTSVYYIDILNSLERMGDFIINISRIWRRPSYASNQFLWNDS